MHSLIVYGRVCLLELQHASRLKVGTQSTSITNHVSASLSKALDKELNNLKLHPKITLIGRRTKELYNIRSGGSKKGLGVFRLKSKMAHTYSA